MLLSKGDLTQKINMATLFCNGTIFPRWSSRFKTDKSLLDQYYSWNNYSYDNIALPKWIWRLVRMNQDAGKFFDFASSFSHTDSNGNITSSSVSSKSKASRWDVNSSLSGYGGTLYWDDVQRAKQTITSMAQLDGPISNLTEWWWPIEGTETVLGITSTSNGSFTLTGTQPTYPGFTRVDFHKCAIYHPESAFGGVYEYTLNSQGESIPDTLHGTIFSDIIHLDIDVTHATDGNYNSATGIYSSTLYKTRKLVRIGGAIINKGYINSDDYARGWRTTNSTEEDIAEFDIGEGISWYKKVLTRNYTSTSPEVTQFAVGQGGNLNRTFGGDIEGGAGQMGTCKMEPTLSDFDLHFVQTW